MGHGCWLFHHHDLELTCMVLKLKTLQNQDWFLILIASQNGQPLLTSVLLHRLYFNKKCPEVGLHMLVVESYGAGGRGQGAGR